MDEEGEDSADFEEGSSIEYDGELDDQSDD